VVGKAVVGSSGGRRTPAGTNQTWPVAPPVRAAVVLSARPVLLPGDLGRQLVRSVEIVAVLRNAADLAADLTELLDVLRDRYRADGLQGPHPTGVALEQAAAAAHDLQISARTAAESIVVPPS
jgi:hypothetical protein